MNLEYLARQNKLSTWLILLKIHVHVLDNDVIEQLIHVITLYVRVLLMKKPIKSIAYLNYVCYV